MKKIFCTLVLSLILYNLWADGGNCVRYQIAVTLKNDTYIEGFVFRNTFYPKFEFSDQSIKSYLLGVESDPEKSLIVYLNLQSLAFPQLSFKKASGCKTLFNACAIDDVRTLAYKDIKDIRLIEFNICNNCDTYDLEDGFRTTGVYPNVITELNSKEIDLLQTKPVSVYEFTLREDVYDLFKVLSYNPSIDAVKLKDMCDEFLQSFKSNAEKMDAMLTQKRYKTFKQKLRSQNVIVFEIGFIP